MELASAATSTAPRPIGPWPRITPVERSRTVTGSVVRSGQQSNPWSSRISLWPSMRTFRPPTVASSE
jgi:hypothetical protein